MVYQLFPKGLDTKTSFLKHHTFLMEDVDVVVATIAFGWVSISPMFDRNSP
jgi:superfamily II DNA helicase RecQ